jgi:catechol 2,3-dioxygenase-like lactoylglutathione lyase family enzyme
MPSGSVVQTFVRPPYGRTAIGRTDNGVAISTSVTAQGRNATSAEEFQGHPWAGVFSGQARAHDRADIELPWRTAFLLTLSPLLLPQRGDGVESHRAPDAESEERMIRHHDDAEGMADQPTFSTSIIHHLGLRVEDAQAGKRWLTTMLGFRVEREFQFAGHDFVFLSAGGAKSPVIELIGGPLEDERQLPENIPDMLKLAGWNHICLQVGNVEECIADLRRRGVRVLVNVCSMGRPEAR